MVVVAGQVGRYAVHRVHGRLSGGQAKVREAVQGAGAVAVQAVESHDHLDCVRDFRSDEGQEQSTGQEVRRDDRRGEERARRSAE